MSAKHRGKSAKSLAMVEAAERILREIQPASVRAVCYRLFTEGLIPDMSKGSTAKVSKQLVWARESGKLPWGWIVDETREPERVASWDDPADLLRAASAQYRKDYWADQPARVEVWSEKGTIRGTLAPVLREYGVTFRVMHGYGSATAIYGAAEDTAASDRPFHALYVGDWDPSGLHMSEVDLPSRLARYGGDAVIKRIALTQGDLNGLPHFDAATKKGDTRHTWFTRKYGDRCWELDAMPPPDLRKRVEAEILSLLDLDRWNRAVEVEGVEKESMTDFLAEWNRIKSRQVTNCSGGA